MLSVFGTVSPSDVRIMYNDNILVGQVMAIHNTSIALACNCTSRPAANYSWIYPGGKKSGQQLQLTVEKSYEGDFICSVENYLLVEEDVLKGHNSTSVSLSVLCKYNYSQNKMSIVI